MLSARQAWKKRVDGAFVGTFLHCVAGRVVCKLYRERLRAIWCLQNNGKTAWDREFESDEIGVFFPYRDRVYVDGTTARRLDIETGTTVAERQFGDRVYMQPPIPSGPVYILGDVDAPKSLMGLHPDTLATVWEWPDPNYNVEDTRLCRYEKAGIIRLVDLSGLQEREVRCPKPIGLHGHSGELLCQFNERERFAVSTVSGRIVWQHEEPEEGFHGGEVHDTIFVADVAYCGGRALSAYDLRTGKVLWRQSVEGNPGRLRVEGGRVYAGTKGGLVYMLDAQTGEVLLRHDLKVEPTAIAPLAPNRIVVGTYKVIYCLEVG